MTGDEGAIVRTWHATATSEGAEEYRRYFAGTLLPQLRSLSGFAGAHLLARDLEEAGTVELTTHTFWESLAAIRAFAGDDITKSVVEPEARAALLTFEGTATHRSLWVDARG
jgi:heme-degrading monooxygenase HmoA